MSLSEDNFELAVSVVKCYKNLYETHAKLLICMLEEGKPLTVRKVSELLSKIGGSDFTSRADELLKGLEGKGLVTRVQDKPKKYQAVPPSQFLSEILDINQEFKKQIEALEQAQEIVDFDKEDPLNLARKLDKETDVLACMHHLLLNGNNLLVVRKDEEGFKKLRLSSMIERDFKKEIKNKRLQIINGLFNSIIIKDKKGINNGVILILKRPAKKGGIRIYGSLLMDKDLGDLLSAEKGV